MVSGLRHPEPKVPMTPLAALLLAATLSAGPSAPAPRPYQDDAKAIQGKWEVVLVILHGQNLPSGYTLEVEGDQFSIKGPDGTIDGRLRLDGTAHPKALELRS